MFGIIAFVRRTAEMTLSQYKQKWSNHVSRMEDIKYPNNSLTVYLSEEEELHDH
jgi:hypothetical protein